MGYSRTVLKRSSAIARARGECPNITERFHIETAYSALMKARLHIMLAERVREGSTDLAMENVLLAMDFLKPGAIAKLMPLHEDER